MDTRTGEIYASRDEAIRAGARPEDVVEMDGPAEAVRRVSSIVARAARDRSKRLVRERKRQARRRRAMQAASRKANR